MILQVTCFVMLCVVSVYCQLPEVRPGLRPVDPERIRPLPPMPLPIWPIRRCYARHGGWHWDVLPIQSYPTPPPNVFYWGCKVWRPTWSSCKGYCESYDNITTQIPSKYSSKCECCRSSMYQLIKPSAYCLVIRIINGIPTWQYEWVDVEVPEYNYVLAGKCGCFACGRRDVSPDDLFARPEEVNELAVAGRPSPPIATPAEVDEEFAKALGELPILTLTGTGGSRRAQ